MIALRSCHCFDVLQLVLYAIYLVIGLRYDVHILHFMINRVKVACGFHLVVLDGWINRDLCPSDLLCPTFCWSGVT